MIKPKNFYDLLIENEITFFTGVPDSLLRYFCYYVTDNVEKANNVTAANEGAAISLAAGYYLATNKIGLVYMQNSGQGNSVNPLTSLADPEVYKIPMLLLIGWRGEPGKKDEPQHIKQGKITLKLLDIIEIPYKILPNSIEETEKVLEEAIKYMKEKSAPFALVAKKDTFEEYALKNKPKNSFNLNREYAIKLVANQLSDEDIIISTTGKTSRELFEYREKNKQSHDRDFLTVGSMGHASQIALAIALQKPEKKVYCFDGDGALIMHMGALSIIGQQFPKNFKHILFNNGAHDSVGGQATAAFNMDIPGIAISCGYNKAFSADNSETIIEKMKTLKETDGPVLLEIKVNRGARKDLGRPTASPIENKKKFMNFLRK